MGGTVNLLCVAVSCSCPIGFTCEFLKGFMHILKRDPTLATGCEFEIIFGALGLYFLF